MNVVNKSHLTMTMSPTLYRAILRIDRAKQIDAAAWQSETPEAFNRRIEAFRLAKQEKLNEIARDKG